MTEDQAKQHLATMLESFTVGSVLHLLADHFHEQAEQARRSDNAASFDRAKLVQHCLIVVGMGMDAAFPS